MITCAIALILITCFLGMADSVRSQMRSRKAIRRVLEASPDLLPPRRPPIYEEESETELRKRIA